MNLMGFNVERRVNYGIICMLIRDSRITKVFVLCYKYCYYGHIRICRCAGISFNYPVIAAIISIVSPAATTRHRQSLSVSNHKKPNSLTFQNPDNLTKDPLKQGANFRIMGQVYFGESMQQREES